MIKRSFLPLLVLLLSACATDEWRRQQSLLPIEQREYTKLADLASAIDQKIKPRLIIPVDPKNFSADTTIVAAVWLKPDGMIEKQKITVSSGHAGLDQAIENAIKSAQPFPLLLSWKQTPGSHGINIVFHPFAVGGVGQGRLSVKGEVLKTGVYTANVKRKEDNLASPSGKRSIVENVEWQQSSDLIVGRPGVRFGILYKLSFDPRLERIPVTEVTRFPAPGIPNDAGETFSSTRYTLNVDGSPHTFGYSIDTPQSHHYGKWTFEVWNGKDLLVSKTFQVVPEQRDFESLRP